MAIKKINTDLQIEAGLLDGDGNSGTANQILISTGTGVDWVDGSGSSIIGGPYLPLAGGTMTGQLTFPYGFLGDYIYHTGDSNTYFGFSSSDTFSLFTGGSNRLHVNSAGNVGIGTTSPSAKLHLEGDAIIEGVLRADNFNLGLGGAIKLKASNSLTDQYVAFGTTPSGSNGNATFTEKMRINSDGNVGIGTTSPGQKLDVVGGFIRSISTGANLVQGAFVAQSSTTDSPGYRGQGYFTHNQELDVSWYMGTPYTNGDMFVINRQNTAPSFDAGAANMNGTNVDNFFAIKNNGNVGIGTTSPLTKLEVYDGDIKLNDSTRNLLIGEEGSSSYQIKSSGYLIIDATSGIQINKTTSGNVTIGSGNVGIGTTSPNNFGFLEKVLNISAGSSSSTTLQQAGIVISGSSDADDADDFGYLSFTNYQSAITNDRVAEIRALKNGTNVDTGEFAFYTSSGSGPAERMRIDSSGNVGIGTSSPNANAKLHLYNSASATDVALRLTSNANSKTLIGFGDTVDQTAGAIKYDNATSEMSFEVLNSTEAMRIDSDGNVGIGTTSPTANLYVSGSNADATDKPTMISESVFTVKPVALNSGNLNFAQVDSGNSIGMQYTNGSGTANWDISMQPFGGNVGIGTTSPDSLLHIKGADPVFIIQDTSTGTANASSTLRLGESGSGGLLDVYWDIKQAADDLNTHLEINHSANGNHLTILDGGNVGIGTTSPLNRLFVTAATAGDYAGFIENTNATNGYGLVARTAHTGTSAYAFAARAGTNDIFVVRGDGNVGIGTTSPSYKFELQVSQPDENPVVYSQFGGNNGVTGNSFLQIGGARGSAADERYSYLQTLDGAGGFRILSLNPSGGNVGIGTTSPVNKLNVNGDIGYIGVIGQGSIYGNTGNSSYANMQLYDPATGYSTFNNQSYGYYLQTGGSTKLTILNNGNVGIGTTSPVAKLDVAGNGTGPSVYNYAYAVNAGMRIHGNESALDIIGTDSGNHGSSILLRNADEGFGLLNNPNLNTLQFRSFTATADAFNIHDTGSGLSSLVDIITLEKTGNVGIGTTSPGQKLEVIGRTKITQSGDALRINSSDANGSYATWQNNGSNIGYIGAGYHLWSSPNNIATSLGIRAQTRLDLGIQASVHMTILNTGNVGIGTTSPAVQLELGDNTADEKLRLTGAASGKPLMTFYNTTTKIGQIASSPVGVTVTSLGSGNMSFENGGNNRLVIDNSGNVGIADTSPSYKLDVDGTIRATGDVIAYSDIRVKENIKTIDNAVSKVNKLRGVEFNKIGSEEKSIGVIAQEIEKVLPEVVKEDDKGMKSVAYGNIVGVLIEAIKDQQKQIDELKSIINGSTK